MAAEPPICPWAFLEPAIPSSSPPLTKKTHPWQNRSFVQALKNSFAIPISQLPKPCLKGDAISIKISEEEYQQGLQSCQNSLHGRLILAKGCNPVKAKELRQKLAKLWKPIGQWKMVPLGRGYFEFSFASLEDLRSVWTVGTWSLHSQWSADFNPNSMKQTHIQCWIHIQGLAQEYWQPKILFEIAGAVGTPIALDESTKLTSFGHFARVLIDVDLSGNLPNEILVERDSYTFFVGIVHEKLRLFCNFCKNIGHVVDNCNKKEGSLDDKMKKDKQSIGKDPVISEYVAKNADKQRPENEGNNVYNNSHNLDACQIIADKLFDKMHEQNGSLGDHPKSVGAQPETVGAKQVQIDPSVVRQKFPDHVVIISEQVNETQDNTPSKAMEAINECNEVAHINLEEVQGSVVATTSEAGISIDVSLHEYALQPILQNDIRTLSKSWADITDNESEDDISNPDNTEAEYGNSQNFHLVPFKSQKQQLEKTGRRDVPELPFPEVVQKDLQILANFWGQVENDEIDMATNMNNSAATANNFQVVLPTTQRKRTSRKK